MEVQIPFGVSTDSVVGRFVPHTGDESPGSQDSLSLTPLCWGCVALLKPGDGGSLDSPLGLCWHGWKYHHIFFSVVLAGVESLVSTSFLSRHSVLFLML